MQVKIDEDLCTIIRKTEQAGPLRHKTVRKKPGYKITQPPVPIHERQKYANQEELETLIQEG